MSPPPSTAVLTGFITCLTFLPLFFAGIESPSLGSKRPANIPDLVWNCAILIMCLLFQTAYAS